MPVTRQQVVGGIEVDPSQIITAEKGNPRVRSIGADESFLTGRGDGFEIAADITGGQAHGAKTSDQNMGKVLADTAAFGKSIGDQGGHIRRHRIKGEVSKNPVIQLGCGFEDRSPWGKARASIFGKNGVGSNQRRGEAEFSRHGRPGRSVATHHLDNLLPRRRRGRSILRGGAHFHITPGHDLEPGMRTRELEINRLVAVGIKSGDAGHRFWHDLELVPRAFLVGQRARTQPCHVVRDGDRTLVRVQRAMDDVVSHG